MTNTEQALFLIDKRHDIDYEELHAWVRKQVGELQICKHFGCGKKLTLVESLYGEMCTSHSVKVKTDIMKVLKFE